MIPFYFKKLETYMYWYILSSQWWFYMRSKDFPVSVLRYIHVHVPKMKSIQEHWLHLASMYVYRYQIQIDGHLFLASLSTPPSPPPPHPSSEKYCDKATSNFKTVQRHSIFFVNTDTSNANVCSEERHFDVFMSSTVVVQFLFHKFRSG